MFVCVYVCVRVDSGEFVLFNIYAHALSNEETFEERRALKRLFYEVCNTHTHTHTRARARACPRSACPLKIAESQYAGVSVFVLIAVHMCVCACVCVCSGSQVACRGVSV